MGEIIDAATETARPAIEARRHRLRADIEERMPCWWAISAPAADHRQPAAERCEYTVTGVDITLRASVDANEVEFSGATRHGIPSESLPHLFEMFAQLNPARARPNDGLGIGLALSRPCRTHGGRSRTQRRTGTRQ